MDQRTTFKPLTFPSVYHPVYPRAYRYVGNTRYHTPWTDFQSSVTPHQARFQYQTTRFRNAVGEISPTTPCSGLTFFYGEQSTFETRSRVCVILCHQRYTALYPPPKNAAPWPAFFARILSDTKACHRSHTSLVLSEEKRRIEASLFNRAVCFLCLPPNQRTSIPVFTTVADSYSTYT